MSKLIKPTSVVVLVSLLYMRDFNFDSHMNSCIFLIIFVINTNLTVSPIRVKLAEYISK